MAKLKTSRLNIPAGQSIQDRLLAVLQRVNRPGTFVSRGSLAPVLPGLEITNIGAVGFPLVPQQAELIRKFCEQAPYGKGEQTLVDTKVRRVWQMMPDTFRLNNPEWHEFLGKVVKAVGEDLGLEDQQIDAQLYNLLLYEPGSFFLPHRDGEKVDRMVATLVLVLPSVFQGGELIVRHHGQETVIDFGANDDCAYKTHFAAFYADCEHEVLPLRSGLRLCLVYNLTLRGLKGSISSPCNTEHIEDLAQVLRDWQTDAGEADLQKLVIKLDHRYSRAGLGWDTLKGIDRTRAQILREAAINAGCIAHLAELTYWEQGFGQEIYSGPRRRRWHNDGDTKYGSGYVMHEVHENSLTVQLWVSDGLRRTSFGELRVAEDEIVSVGELTDVQPEEQFEGYMGNYGDTLERWYRHAAIVLCPQKYHFDLLCQSGTEVAITELERMVQDLELAQAEQSVDLKAECINLAYKIIDQWQLSYAFDTQPTEARDGGLEVDDDEYTEEDAIDDFDEDDWDSDEDDWESGEEDEEDSDIVEVGAVDEKGYAILHGQDIGEDFGSSFLSCLEALGDASLTRRFLRVVMPKDSSVQLTTSFLEYCAASELAHFRGEFEHIFQNTTPETLDRNVRLFDLLCAPEFCSNDEYRPLRADLVRQLVAALKSIDKQKDDWRSSKIDRARLLAYLVKPLIVSEESEGLASLVSYTLAAPKLYDPRMLAKLLCQLKDWLPQHCLHPCALRSWLDSSVEFLQNETVREPQKPVNFKRAANISCRCSDCKELINFLISPTESICRFKVRQDRRAHLHQIIDSNGCDLTHVTERKGSPQTLVCTKNTNSYQRALEQHREDKEDLAVLRSLQEKLLKLWGERR